MLGCVRYAGGLGAGGRLLGVRGDIEGSGREFGLWLGMAPDFTNKVGSVEFVMLDVCRHCQ